MGIKSFFNKKFKKSANNDELKDLIKQYETKDHLLTQEELQQQYKTDLKNGLTTESALEKEKEHGKNQLTPPKETHIIIQFLKIVFLNIFNILLNFGAILSLIAYILKKNTEYIYLGCVLLAVVLLTSVVTTVQNYSSSQKLKSFKNLLPSNVNVYRDGKLTEKLAIDLLPGDIVEIRAGDKIPADIRILECSQDAKVNNSSITGESEPILRKTKTTNDDPLEAENLILFGTLMVQGKARGLVTKTGDNTMLGQIAKLTATTKTEKTPIGKEISHFIKIISGIAIALGVVFGVINVILTKQTIDTLIFAIGIIVANVPEGLPATLTVSLTIASQRMSNKSVLVKNLEGVETLGSTSVICSDKTGTLTTNKMTVSNSFFDCKQTTIDTHNPVNSEIDSKSEVFQQLLQCAVLCNNAVFNDQNVIVGDASETALLKFSKVFVDGTVSEYREERPAVHSIPFNSKNKWQLSIHRVKSEGSVFTVVMKGAPERVISFCSQIRLASGVKSIGEEERKKIAQALDHFASMGERVLAFCEVQLIAEEFPEGFVFEGDKPETANFPFSTKEPSFVFLGLFAMIDPPRPSVPGSVLKCKRAGIRVFMVTGDHPTTASAIAKKVNIINPDDSILDLNKLDEFDIKTIENSENTACVVTGSVITRFTQDCEPADTCRFWNAVLAHENIVFSRTSPQHKLLIVKACQERNSIVAVTGDGVNDSPALKKADIGVAMGIAGTDVAKEAADMILMDDNFSSIVNGVEEGRVLFDNLKKSIAYTLSSNIPEIAPFLVKVLLGFPYPLKTIQIFTIDLGTDLVPAISMAFEKKESDIMKIPARNPLKDRLVSKVLIGFSYLMIGMIQMCAAFFAYFVVMHSNKIPVRHLFKLDYQNQFESCSEENTYLSCKKSYQEKCTYHPGTVTLKNDDLFVNMECNDRKSLLAKANAAYVIAIVIVQVSDVIISKTRRNSVFVQGMGNWVMNFGIVFELGLIALLTYVPDVAKVFSFNAVEIRYWGLAIPFFVFIVVFDELRKFFLRRNFEGWVKRNTYW